MSRRLRGSVEVLLAHQCERASERVHFGRWECIERKYTNDTRGGDAILVGS